MIERLHALLLRVFRRLPTRARRIAVRSLTPSYYVGAICLVQREDGRRLFVRHTYRRRWGTPDGGQAARRAARARATSRARLGP